MTVQPHERQALLNVPQTPAFIYSEQALRQTASRLASLANRADCKLLYSIKACDFAGIMEVLAPFVDGFGTSSLFEARLAREVLGNAGSIHTFSPALGPGYGLPSE